MKNKSHLFPIVIVLLFVMLCNTQLLAQKMEYYRHLVFRETPYSDVRGIHPIDNETANKEAHYRFVFDAQNRLTEVSHRIGNDLIADNGNWDTFIWFSPKMTIAYDGDKEIRHFYNIANQRIEAHGKMYKAVFQLDNQGRRTSVALYDKDNNPSENAWGIHTYQWTHTENGTVIEKRFNLKNESTTMRPNLTFYTIRLEFGEDDLLDFVYHIDEDGNLINNTMKAAIDRIVYDQEENFSRWMVFDKDKKPVEGNAPGFAIGEHLYDAKGNKVGLRGFDVEGRLKAFPNGIAKEVHVFDEFNNPTESKFYDIDNNLLQYVKRIYSNDGKRIEWLKLLDENGELTMHPTAKFAAMKMEYDTNGLVIERKRYDEKLEEIKTNN
ncbi:MAG TPA: hypothetical protein EYO35_12550 [Flavobacteriaceae bacterium]|nr:hypothetical protein [Flavobacteriaceae bacterium]